MNDSIGMVLVPGAGLGAWIWRDLTPLLKAPAVAVDFPGRSVDVKTRQALSLEDYVTHIESQIAPMPDRVVIVAHSFGGVVGLRLAQHLHARMAGFVALSAAIPRDGGSFLSCLPRSKRVAMSAILRLVGTKVPESAIRKGLTHDLSSELAAEVVERFTPESRRVYFDRTEAAVPRVPTLYVKTARDQEFASVLQDNMIANLGADVVHTVESGHLAMLSHPVELADTLNGFVTGLAAAPS